MYDLAVIGLGSAGIEAINFAIKNNLNVIAFEEGVLGGTCLNKGCIPTKSILHSSNTYSELKNLEKLGIKSSVDAQYNWQEILSRKNNIVSKFTKALDLAFSKNLTLIRNKASLKISNNKATIFCNNEEYIAKNIIIATGSKARELPNLKFDNEFILNSDDIFNLEKLPKNITIIGSGAIGLEWTQIFSSLEVDVTVIEKAPNLAPLMDTDIQKRLDRILKQKNIKFYKNDFITALNNKKITLNSGVEFETDMILVAVGRVNILPESNEKIEILDDYKTNIENVFVIGDAKNKVMLAHSASYDARNLLNNIIHKKELKEMIIPSVIYITPEIASIGIKEQDIAGNNDYKIVKFMLPTLAKSWCDEASDGFVKAIFKDDKIVGAHIVSKNACELVAMFSIIITNKLSKDDILNTIFPHPSYSEIIWEIAKNA